MPKLNTVIAGGNLPDLLSNIHTGVANAPELMRTQCADLTAYLSGDAVKVPNKWRADSNGKLVRDYETEEFKAAVAFTRDLYVAGVFHPNSTTYNG